jgi:SurA-like N-terminal domain
MNPLIKREGIVVKRWMFLIIVISVFPVLFGCGSDEEAEKGQTVARINQFEMSLDDFKRSLRAELEFTPEVKLTDKVKKNFIEELIRKELLIQEAKKRGLDSRDEFIRAIERYWESTLIRNLLEEKGKEIQDQILISEEEIREQYERLKIVDGDLPPASEMHDQIGRYLKEEKKTMHLQEWINGLWAKSEIEINKDLLYGKK